MSSSVESLLVLVVCTFGSLVGDSAIGGDERSHPSRSFGVRVVVGDRDFRIRRISAGDGIRCLTAIPATVSNEQNCKIYCAVKIREAKGYEPRLREVIDDDAPDAIVVIDPSRGEHERIDFHQPGPSAVVSSPNGEFIAFTSDMGSHPRHEPGAGGLFLKRPAKNRLMSSAERRQASRRLEHLTVGTVHHSIWRVAPARLEWELRHHDDAPGAAIAAKFERPGAKSAQLALPWWAIEGFMRQAYSKACFSPDSKHFVAIDGSHGFRILRLRDGKQEFISSEKDAVPRELLFSRDPQWMYAIMEDGTVRTYDLDSCAEMRQMRTRLPDVTPSGRIDPTDLRFCINRYPGVIVTVTADGTLQLTKLLDQESDRSSLWSEPTSVENVKCLTGHVCQMPCRIRVSLDGKSAAIGYRAPQYGQQFGFSDFGVLSRSELVDLDSMRVTKRVVNPEFDGRIVGSRDYGDVPTIHVHGSFDACLSADGRDLIYATVVDE